VTAQARAVWIHLFDDTLKSPASVDRMLDRVAAARFNTVIVEVVRRQDSYYTSNVLPRTTDPNMTPGFDMLAHVIQGARARGLAVHAWVPVVNTWHGVYSDIPHPDGWIWTDHGPNAPEADRWVTRLANGTWSDYLDPGLPEVRDHITAVMAELASRYRVDGVHLDYARYPSRDAGYHPRALERWRAETGSTGTPSPDNVSWSNWRRAQVDALVTQVRNAVRAADPNVKLTAAVIAQGEGPHGSRTFAQTRAYADYFQHWVGWAQTGMVDAVMPMTYFRADQHGEWFDQWLAFNGWLAGQVNPLVVGGYGGWLNTPEASLDQIARTQNAMDGSVLFSYQQTASTQPYDALFDLLPQRLWTQRAPVPRQLLR
jgi:uncharacterized lipoprotein YddW (UPF0748 family)